MFTRGFGRLGAVSAVLLACACGGNAAGPAASQENNGSQDTELGEAFASCTTGTGWTSPNLAINASATTSHSIILSPGAGVVKVNGHTCVDSNGTAIQLSAIKSITLTGAAAGSPDTFVLDFSLGLPSGQLLSADGIVVNGNEAVGTTNSDIVIFKGSGSADNVTVGRSTTYTTDQTMVMALTSTGKTNNIRLKNLGDGADAHPPTLIFMMGNGDDVFSAMGNVGTFTAAVATPVTVYGGAGNDTLSGGAGADTLYGGPGNDTFVSAAADGADKYDGGGDVGDLMDYSGRGATHPVFVDLNSTVVKVWGKNVLGTAMATETVDIDPGNTLPITVTFASEATPMAIRDAINNADPTLAGVASLVGTRIVLQPTLGASLVLANTAVGVTTKLGFADGTYSNVANDGEANEHDDVQNINYLYGGAGDDTLVGSDQSNVIDGKAGDDILNGGPANGTCANDVDTLRGDVGNDWFDMGTVADCNQTITDVSGLDVIDYSQRTGAVNIKIDNTAGSGRIAAPAEADKISTDIEIVLGSAFGDTIIGNGSANYIFAGGGNDTVSAGPGNDYVWGGPGDDTLNGESGDDTFFELTSYQAANAVNEPLANVAMGKWKGLGLAIYGAASSPGAGNDIVNGGIGTDKIDLTDAAHAVSVTLCLDTASTGVTGTGTGCGAAGNYGADDDDGQTTYTTNNYVNVEWVAGGPNGNMMVGTSADEVFEGGALVDVILGQGGNDTIYGFSDGGTDATHSDLLCGGDGDDTITGGGHATVEGEGQMSVLAPNKFDVTLSDASTKDVHTCVTRAQTYALDKSGVNVCFGGNTYVDCANH